MASAFNLTAELNLRGPANLRQVVGNIRQQLSGLSLNLTVDPRTASNVSNITRNVNSLSTAATSATRNVAALDAALRRLGTSANSAQRAMSSLSTNVNTFNRNVNTVSRSAQAAATGMEGFGRQAGLAIKRFAAFTTVTAAFYGFSRALVSAYKEFITFNRELVRLQQVTEGTASSLTGLVSEITNVSQKFGVSSADILSVSVTLAQAGLSANQTKVALEALAKSALAPSFDDLNHTVEGSIALMRQFGIEAGQLEGALGSINAVAAKFAVEAGDIIAAIQRTGGVFAAASRGVSEGTDALNEFIAVFTSVRATTRESAETIATGLRTIFSRIQRGETISALKEYGVNLTDVEGKFVGAYKAVQLLSQGLSKLDPRDLRFSAIVEELGGFRQVGKVIPLIQQFATAQQALGVAQRGAGSLALDAATAQEALSVKITKVREEFIALIRDLGQSQSFQRLVDMSLMLASSLIKVADAAKEVLPAIAAIGAIRGLSGISGFTRGFRQGLRGNNRRGFASGGVVPGSGNSDTVPAMLTPGEFVIRKNAVKAIGTDRLHRMNRYADGGIVQKFAQKQPTYNSGAVKTEDRIRQGMIGKDSYRFGLVGLRSGTKSKQSRKENFPLSIGKKDKKKTYNVDLYISSLSEAISGRIDKQIEKSIKKDYEQSVRSTAQQLSAATKGSANITQGSMNKALKGNALYSVIGSIFEAGLTAIGSPYLDKTEKTKSMDFPFGLGPIAQSFNGMPGNIPTDATRTVGGRGKGLSQMKMQMKRFITATEKDYFTAAEQKKLMKKNAVAGAKNIKQGASVMGSVFSSLPISGTTSARASLAGTLSVKARRGVLDSFFKKWGLSRRDLAKAKDSDNIVGWNKIPPDRHQEFVDNINSIRNTGFYNKGGSVDTVPAMLTPGEFVINKRAASRLGSSQLNTLNKADKIQGFNKGGSVGGVQHMAGGGIVGIFSGLGRTVENLTRRMRLLTMSVPQGGGWTGPGVTPLSTVTRGGVQNNRRFQQNGRGQASQIAMDPMSLLFAAGFVGDAFGGATGGAITGGAINAGIVGSIGQAVGLSPGLNGLAMAVAGVVGAIDGWNEALNKDIIEKNNAKIEGLTKTLEDQFKQLSQQASITGTDLQNLGANIAEIGRREQENRNVAIQQSQGSPISSFLNGIFQDAYNAYFGQEGMLSRGESATFANIPQGQLSKDLYSSSKQQAESINSIIQTGLKKGLKFDDIIKGLGVPNNQARRSLAILQGGQEITDREARIASMRQRGVPEENIKLEEGMLKARITALSNEYKKQAIEANKTAVSVRAAVNALDLFVTKIQQIADRISAIGAIREEEFRRANIEVGSRLGDRGFAGPSGLNLAILENAAAFDPRDIKNAIQNIGNNLGIDPQVLNRLQQSTLAEAEIRNELPSLLAEAADIQARGGQDPLQFVEEKISDILSGFELPDSNVLLKNIMQQLAGDLESGTSLQDMANNGQALQGLLESLSQNRELLIAVEKEYQNQLKQTQQAMNKLADTLERVDELRINAENVRIEGDLNLRKALGMDISLADMNKPFEQSILGLTSTINPKTGRRMGGTLSPDEIGRRREEAEQQKAEAEKQRNAAIAAGDPNAINAWTLALQRSERNIRNLDKAQEKLATDATRASNALAKIQEIRQQEQRRGEAFFDLASNINDPQWVDQFLQDFASYQRVQNGTGTLADLEGAISAFNRRAQVLPEGQRQAEQFQLAQQMARIMSNAGGPGAPTAPDLMNMFFPGGPSGVSPATQAAIDEYNKAIEAMARANEVMADTLLTGADILYDRIVKAGQDFAQWIGVAINQLMGGNPVVPGVPVEMQDMQARATGGLIYANKGKYINFQPKGTDTVPAMLTPGEFVVNAKATKKNLSLLKAINSNKSAKVGGYQSGGAVYLEDGGLVPDLRTYDIQGLDNLLQFRYDQLSREQELINSNKDPAIVQEAELRIARLNAEIEQISARKAYMEKTGIKPDESMFEKRRANNEREARVAAAKEAQREGKSPPPGYSSWEEYDSTPEKEKEQIAKTNREAKAQKNAQQEAHQKRQSGQPISEEERELAFKEDNNRIAQNNERSQEALKTGKVTDKTENSITRGVDQDRQASGQSPLFDQKKSDDINERAKKQKAEREANLRPTFAEQQKQKEREGKSPPYGVRDWDTYDVMTNSERQKAANASRQLEKDNKRLSELKELYDINDINDFPRDPKDAAIWEKYRQQKRQADREKEFAQIGKDIDKQMEDSAAARKAETEAKAAAKKKEIEENERARAAKPPTPEDLERKAKFEEEQRLWKENFQKERAAKETQEAEADKVDEQRRMVEARKKAALTADGQWRPKPSDYPAGAKGEIEYSKDLMAAQKVNDENFAAKRTQRAEQAKRDAAVKKEEQRQRDEAARPIQEQKYQAKPDGTRTLKDELNDAKAAEQSTKSNATETYNNQGFIGQIGGGRNNTFTKQVRGSNHNMSRIEALEEKLKKATTQEEIDSIRAELRAIKSGSSEQAKQAIKDAESHAGVGTGKEGKWNESSNTAIKAIGNVGGALQGVEEAAYGAANVVAGTAAGFTSSVSGGIGYALSGAGDVKTSDGKVKQANKYNESEFVAAERAAAEVAVEAIDAGMSGIAEGAQAIVGQGAIQRGEETILQKNDAKNREIAARGNMGYLTGAAQFVGRTSAGAVAEAGIEAGIARGVASGVRAAIPTKPVAPRPSGPRPSGDDLMDAANDFSKEMAEKEAARQNARMRTNRQVGTQGGGRSTNVGGQPRQITSQTDVSRGTTGSQLRDPTTGRFTGQKPGGTFEVGRGPTPSQSRNPDTGRFGPRMEGRWESGIERSYSGPGTSSFSTADSLPSGPLQMPGMPSAPPAGVKGRGTTTDYTMTVGPQKPVRGTTTTLNQRPQSNMGSGLDSFGPTVGGPGSSNIRTRSDLPRVSRTTDKPITRPTMSQMDTGTRPPVAVTEKDAAKLARGYIDDTMPTAPKPTPTPTKQTTSPSATKKGGSTSSGLSSARRADEFPLGRTSGKQRNVNRSSRGQSEVTGWKSAIRAGGDTPEAIAKNNAKLEKYLQDNYPDQWKSFGDFYRLYNLEGSLDEAQSAAARISDEVGDLLDRKFVYENDVGADALTREFAPGIRGRFDITGNTPKAEAMAKKVYKDINSKPLEGASLSWNRDPTSVLKTSDSYGIGKRLGDRTGAIRKAIADSSDPAEIAKLQKILKQEEDALSRVLTETYPEYAGSAGRSASSTPTKKGGSSTSNALDRPSFAEMIPGLDSATDAVKQTAQRNKMTAGGQRRQAMKDKINEISFMEPRADSLPTISPKKGGSTTTQPKVQELAKQKSGDLTAEENYKVQQYLESRKPINRAKNIVAGGVSLSLIGGAGSYYAETLLQERTNTEQERRLKEEEERLKRERKNNKKPVMRSSGGLIYASNGTLVPYAPRGTDTVPAMLTPGEFVINKRATRENFGLLKAINSGQYLQSGGIVKPKYFDNGGFNGGGLPSSSGSGGVSLSVDTGNFDSGVQSFEGSVGSFNSSIGSFTTAINSMVGAVSNIGNLDFSSLNTTFEAINSSASLLSGSASGFSQVLNQFNTSIGSLQSALGNVKDINLNVTGSIPVDVNVTVNGGDGLAQQLEGFKTQIYNDIATQINQKTNGGIKLDIRSN